MSTDAITELENYISQKIKSDEILAKFNCEVRGSHAVADCVGDMLQATKCTLPILSSLSGIPRNRLEDICIASPSKPVSVFEVKRIADALGYLFEIQVFPTSMIGRATELVHVKSGDGNLGGIFIRIRTLSKDGVSRLVFGGISRLAIKHRRRLVLAKQKQPELIQSKIPSIAQLQESYMTMATATERRSPTIGYLIRIADSADFKLQLRFPRSVKIENRAFIGDIQQPTGRTYEGSSDSTLAIKKPKETSYPIFKPVGD